MQKCLLMVICNEKPHSSQSGIKSQLLSKRIRNQSILALSVLSAEKYVSFGIIFLIYLIGIRVSQKGVKFAKIRPGILP